MNKITAIKEKIKPHITSRNIAAASVVTTIAVVAYYRHKYTGKILFELTPASHNELRELGGGVVYTYDGDDYLLMILRSSVE